MKPARAILLDMDGLLLDTERVSYRAFGESAAALGLDMTLAQYVTMIGLRAADIPDALRGMFGPGAPVEALHRRADARYAELIEQEPVPLRPGVGELFDFLDDYGWRRAVATSTHSARAAFKLEKAGLLARVERVVGGEAVARGKPFPDIYLKAAEPFCLPPAEVVVLEDSRAGVRGAAAAGMRVAMVPDLQPPGQRERALAAAVFEGLGDFVRAAREGRI